MTYADKYIEKGKLLKAQEISLKLIERGWNLDETLNIVGITKEELKEDYRYCEKKDEEYFSGLALKNDVLADMMRRINEGFIEEGKVHKALEVAIQLLYKMTIYEVAEITQLDIPTVKNSIKE